MARKEPIRYFSVGSDLPLTLALLVDVSGSQRTFIGDEWRASDIFFESMLTNKQDRATLVQVDAARAAVDGDDQLGLGSSSRPVATRPEQCGIRSDAVE